MSRPWERALPRRQLTAAQGSVMLCATVIPLVSGIPLLVIVAGRNPT